MDQTTTMNGVKIPWYACLPLIALTVGVIWWQGTRQKEFLLAPDEPTLAKIRQETKDELKANVLIAPEEPARAIRVKPKKLVVPDADKDAQALLKPDDFGDPTVSPGLDCYLVLASRGATVMSNLAMQLEARGQTQRALLAWERVIDSTDADTSQQEVARKAIQRLRAETPLWNVDPSASTIIQLHVSCDRERGKTLESTLLEIIALWNQACSGLVELQLKTHSGPKAASGSPPQPVALWFTGVTTDAMAPKTLSVPLTNAPVEQQKQLLLTASYKLLKEGLKGRKDLRPLADPQGHDPAFLLGTAVTRRAWDLWAQHFSQKKP